MKEVVAQLESARSDHRVFLIKSDDKIDFNLEAQLWAALSESDVRTWENLI